jgi:hypothetical protein
MVSCADILKFPAGLQKESPVLVLVQAKKIYEDGLSQSRIFPKKKTSLMSCPILKGCSVVMVKVKVSRYTPWRRMGGEEVWLLLNLNLGTRWG